GRVPRPGRGRGAGRGAGLARRPAGGRRDPAAGAARGGAVISQRTREAGFMAAPALAGVVGIGAVAAARADTLDLSPLPGAVAVLAVFLAMHFALRIRAPYADPYVLPLVGLLTAIGLVELNRISPQYALDQ